MKDASPEMMSLFCAALERPSAEERSAYLQAACGGDAQLRARIEALLRAHEGAGGERPSPGVARLSPTVDEPVAERPGAFIGPYKLLEQIGEGGFGVVFMAEQAKPVRRKVALKVLKPGMDTRQVVARFEAERQALALMDHPHIAKVFDGGATPSGRPYFVMELVKGVPITDFCDQHQLTPKERLGLFLPVCQAVQHAHHKGIIHRDLKPSNILVVMHDTTSVPKVIDFGIAKALGQELTDKTLFTGFAQMVGTPLYMSPEQAGQSGLDVDTRSDVYSLGVLLYELLTGTTPFDKERFRQAAYDEIRRIIREEEPPKPSTRLSELSQASTTHRKSTQEGQYPPYGPASVSARRQTEPAKLTRLVKGELDWIVMKALEKDRTRRYETASAFAADVQRYLNDEPVEACPPSALYRFRKFARRHRRGLLTAAVVTAVVILTAGGSGVFIWRANQDLHQALAREERGAYRQRIALADREYSANNVSRAEALLEQCPPDLRGWEWHFLKRLGYRPPARLRHQSAVLSVAFNRDGKLLATGTQAGVVTIWQARTGRKLQEWQAHQNDVTSHQNDVTSVVFSPDGRSLATGSWDQTVKVWDVEKVLQGEVNEPLLRREHTSRVWSVTFSPDGRRLASAGRSADEKGELKVWDLDTGQEALTLNNFSSAVKDVLFSPDGRRLATCSLDLVQVWDAQTGRQLTRHEDPKGYFQKVAFSPDGRRLAAVGGLISVHPDREVKVWDVQTGQEVFSLRGHVGGLTGLASSHPDVGLLASAGLDQTIKLWDAATGHEVLTLRGHLDNVYCLAFSPDGRRLASASVDKTVRIWDATPVEQEPIREDLTLRGHTGAVTDVAFHPAGRSLASAGMDGKVRVWDARSGKELYTLDGSPIGMRRLAYSPDGRRLAAVPTGVDEPVRVWDTETKKETGRLEGHRGSDLCLAFSPDGRHLASGGFDFLVRLRDVTTGAKLREPLQGHNWPIHGVAFSPDGRYLASGSSDTTVRVWDWKAGRQIHVLGPGHAARVENVAFSRDGEWLASAGWDRTIKVWKTRTGELVHELHDPNGAVQCVAFGPNRRLAWGSTDSAVKVWDGPGTEIHVLRGHTSWVQGVAFSPDPEGKWIASASLDGTVKVYEAPPEPEPPAAEAGGRRK